MAETIRTKVAVVGLGAAGASALWALARAGCDVVGIEQAQLAHAEGSSHGQTRLLRVAYAEGAKYVPLVRRAIVLWRELEQASGTTIFHNTGVFYAGSTSREFIASSLASARSFDVRLEEGIAPPHRLQMQSGWSSFLETEGGFLESDRALAALADQAVRLGARVMFETPVSAIEPRGRGVVLETRAGTVHADCAIVASGVWASDLVPEAAPHLFAERKVLHWFAGEDRRFSLDGGFKPFLVDIGGECALYGFPTIDDRGLKIAEHSFGDPVAGDIAERAVTSIDIVRIERLVRGVFGDLGPPLESKVCFYPMSRDGHFIVDRLGPIVVGAGLSGHGFKFAPMLGEALANLALGREQAVDIGFLSLKRFG